MRKIIDCPECGKNVPSNADYCPECGGFLGAGNTAVMQPVAGTSPSNAPLASDSKIPFYKSKLGIGLIIGAVVLILGCCLVGAIAGIFYLRSGGQGNDYQTLAKGYYSDLGSGADEINSSIKQTNENDLAALNGKLEDQQGQVKQISGDLEDLDVAQKDQDSRHEFIKALQAYSTYLDDLSSCCDGPLDLDLSKKTSDISDRVDKTNEAFDDFRSASPFLDAGNENMAAGRTEIISMLERTRKGLALKGLKVTPNPFSPNGDGADDSLTLSFDAPKSSLVTVEIFDQGGVQVKAVASKQQLSAAKYESNWVGDDNLGNILANGTYNFKITCEFDNTSKVEQGTITIEGVALVCTDCGGSGIKSCSNCGGGGSVKCNNCGGDGAVNCAVCGGSGLCPTCGGDGGYYTELGWWDCEACSGTGVCPDCGGVAPTQACSKCGGDGKLGCSTCGGSGNVTCPTCGGDGAL